MIICSNFTSAITLKEFKNYLKMILYKFNQDGIYSSVEKHEIHEELAKELLSGDYNDGYFKSFSKAKSALNKYIKNQLSEWRYALQTCNELTEASANDYTK